VKIVGVVLIVLGLLALIYGGFTYTSDRHEAELGPLQLELEEKERVNIPVWVGAAAIIGGTVLLLLPRRRRRS
jgi:TRAP-type C4-dicarboxylate transport system permease small subunit